VSDLPYRLVALDIDGTLLDSASQIHPENRAVLTELMARGVHVSLATGKAWRTALKMARSLGLSSPQIANDGASISDPGTGSVVQESHIAAEVAEEAIRLAREIGVTLFVERGNDTLAEQWNDDADYLMEHGNPEPRIVADMLQELDPLPIQFYVVAYRKDELYAQAVRQFSQQFAGRLHVATSSPYYLDMTREGVTKGSALAQVAGMLGIPREQIIAMGDGQNDISLFEAAGVSVAMGQAVDAVKAAAAQVTETNDEGGVAQALRRLFALA